VSSNFTCTPPITHFPLLADSNEHNLTSLAWEVDTSTAEILEMDCELRRCLSEPTHFELIQHSFSVNRAAKICNKFVVLFPSSLFGSDELI